MHINPQHNAVRLISWVDATEPVIEPMALDSLEHLSDKVGSRLTVDMMHERKVMAPGLKMVQGVSRLAVLALSALAVPVGITAACFGAGPVGLLIAAGGGVLLKKKGMSLFRRGLGFVGSAGEAKKRAVTPWDGVRTYEAGQVTGNKPLSKERDLDAVSDFLARGMKRYPKEDLTVVHLMGHGLGHRSNAGLKRADFEKVLEDTVRKAGRRIDVLLMESCLAGNLEGLAGVGNWARFIVCSQESISAGAMGGRIGAAVRLQGDRPVTPSGWATSVVRLQGNAEYQPETLAVVDTEQLPPVLKALDQLGALLRQELKENPAALKAAVEATTMFPKEFPFRSDGRKLGLGDIGQFCRNLQSVYRGREVTTTMLGHFERQESFPEAARSPRAKAILDAAIHLREMADLAVVEKYRGPGYEDTSGLTVQLPTSWLGKIDKKLPAYEDSAAPPQWKSFVTEMSRKL